MRRFGSTLIRAAGLAAVIGVAAACGGGAAASTTAPGSSAAPSKAVGAASSPTVPVSQLPIGITHAQALTLFDYDASKPLNVKDTTPPKTEDGVTVRDITYSSADGTSVVAWLVAPSGSGPFAAVLFLHWLGQANSNRDEFLAEAKVLAKRGVVSLLPTRLFPGVVEPIDWRTDRQSIVDQTLELRRGLDVLLAQPGVDASRLGFVGHDYGALDGAVLAAVDHRVKSVVLMAVDATWADWFFSYFSLSPSDQPEYATAMKAFDPVTFIPDIAPEHLFLQFAELDRFVTTDTASQITSAAGASARSTTYKDATHDLQNSDAATTDREAWLATELGLAK
jgi:dipeptidyl aminopeptidase/acylaminoacyl peptidase